MNYAGTYRDPWCGDVAIADENGQLMIRFTTAVLGQSNTGSTTFRPDGPIARCAPTRITFTLDPDGRVASVRCCRPDVGFQFHQHRAEAGEAER
jgi:hypothetical protein